MIVSSRNQKLDSKRRLAAKTTEQMFLQAIQEGANCPPFVARAILEVAKSSFNLGEVSNDARALKPGQMRILGVATREPAGKPLNECQLKEAVITLDAGIEDQTTRLGDGVSALRRTRLLRIATEALEQDVLLTREDMAYRILNCGICTVTRDVKHFQKLGMYIPLRGWYKDIGPTLTHKVQIIEWYIQRMQPSEITRRTYHSLEAVERYILHFAKVSYLSFWFEKELSPSEIAFLIGISGRLVSEYHALYQRYDNRYYRNRLKEIVSFAKDSSPELAAKKGGSVQ